MLRSRRTEPSTARVAIATMALAAGAAAPAAASTGVIDLGPRLHSNNTSILPGQLSGLDLVPHSNNTTSTGETWDVSMEVWRMWLAVLGPSLHANNTSRIPAEILGMLDGLGPPDTGGALQGPDRLPPIPLWDTSGRPAMFSEFHLPPSVGRERIAAVPAPGTLVILLASGALFKRRRRRPRR